MNWAPTDLLSDVDLSDYEAAILTNFGQSGWSARRTKAIEDWLLPILTGQGFDVQKFRTRYAADQVWAFTASAYTDKTASAADATVDDLDLATIFATISTDAIYIGSTQPFRGVFARLLDNVSAISSVLTVAYWSGTWKAITISDGTIKTAGKTFGQGGSITWTLPLDWVPRAVNSSAQLYFVKLTVSVTPTGAKAAQFGCIRASALRAPVAFRTLQLIFQEAPTGQDGPWIAKAEFYKGEAEAALQRALAICGGEFDSDSSDLVDSDEADQDVSEVSTGWALERA